MNAAEKRISGKNLGILAMPTFCARCFWLRLHSHDRLPYQTFPGIFNSIDSYTKKVVHGLYDQNGKMPPFLAELGEIIGYINPPSAAKYRRFHQPSGVTLTGAPDAVFRFSDETFLIADYKTAKFTAAQDELMPIYVTQLNAYAFIGQEAGIAPVTRLALLYFEPETEQATAIHDANCMDSGFRMPFCCHIQQVELDVSTIPPLLEQVRFFCESRSVPDPNPACKDCERLEALFSLTRSM